MAPAIRVVVVSGAGGKAFVSGADISKFEDERATEAAVKHLKDAADRRQAVEDLGWVLINSKEFLFRH